MQYLLVGLGNPGKAYEGTRHNVGFFVVQALANKYGLRFVKVKGLQGQIARGIIGEKKVLLLMPETYMNSSGEAVKASLAQCDLSLEQVCVVCDDIYLPLGTMRLRSFGGSGGHNGLKSIDSHLGTSEYPRLRIGIGDRKEGDLADHVLSHFQKEELEKLSIVVSLACEALILWLDKGITDAMQFANVCREEKKMQQKLGE